MNTIAALMNFFYRFLVIAVIVLASVKHASAETRVGPLSAVAKSIQNIPTAIPIRVRRKGAKLFVQRKHEDSNRDILLRTTRAVVLETFGLVSILACSTAIPVLRDFPIVALLLVIFCSSTIQSAITGSIASIASNQVRKPNTVPGDTLWYTNLRKPFFNPPGWVFPIMWLLVCKPTQLLATLKLMGRFSTSWLPLTVFCAHLALGDAWNQVFFGRQRIGLGAIVISVFYGMLVLSTALFYNLDPNAGLLLLPTCAWVMVATALNFEIYRLNK